MLLLRIIYPKILSIRLISETGIFPIFEASFSAFVRVGRKEQKQGCQEKNCKADSDHCWHGNWINDLEKKDNSRFLNNSTFLFKDKKYFSTGRGGQAV